MLNDSNMSYECPKKEITCMLDITISFDYVMDSKIKIIRTKMDVLLLHVYTCSRINTA